MAPQTEGEPVGEEDVTGPDDRGEPLADEGLAGEEECLGGEDDRRA